MSCRTLFLTNRRKEHPMLLQPNPTPTAGPAVGVRALTFPIAALMAEISAACEGPPEARGGRIVAALRGAAATPNLLTPDARTARADCYARHTIGSDPAGRFTVLTLVWGPG